MALKIAFARSFTKVKLSDLWMARASNVVDARKPKGMRELESAQLQCL